MGSPPAGYNECAISLGKVALTSRAFTRKAKFHREKAASLSMQTSTTKARCHGNKPRLLVSNSVSVGCAGVKFAPRWVKTRSTAARAPGAAGRFALGRPEGVRRGTARNCMALGHAVSVALCPRFDNRPELCCSTRHESLERLKLASFAAMVSLLLAARSQSARRGAEEPDSSHDSIRTAGARGGGTG